MPTYEYACAKCGEHFDVFQSFSDEPLTRHAGCGGKLSKVLGSVGIVLKGSGFYKTDSRTAAKSGGGRSADNGAGRDSEGGSGQGPQKAGDSNGASSGDSAKTGKQSDSSGSSSGSSSGDRKPGTGAGAKPAKSGDATSA
jgi:putative FmdB family regulatory protein